MKTEGLQPANAFQVLALAPTDNRELAPRSFNLPATYSLLPAFGELLHEQP